LTYGTSDPDRLIGRTKHGDTLARHYFIMMTVCMAAIVLLCLLTLGASQQTAQLLMSEGGPIETVSAAGYIVAVISLVRETSLDYLKQHFYFAIVPIVLCMREMDFHVHFTTISVTKSSFYVSGDVPVAEKLVVLGVLGFIAYSAYRMIRAHAAGFIRGLLRFSPTAVAVALAAGSAVAAKLLDGIGRKLASFGIDLGDNTEIVSLALEEVLELGIPVFLTIAVFAHFTRKEGEVAAPRT
jgi:hypothetical protein